MKKILLIIALITSLPALARDFTYTYEGQTITYTVIDENARTCMTKAGDFSTGGNSVTGDLILPSNPHDGDIEFTLTQVGDFAFFKCDELTSVSLPTTITSLGDYAFCQCKKMTSVNIPDAVTYIGIAAFSGCRQLSSTIIIPDAVTEIGHSSFADCWNIETIKIGNSLKEIQTSSFYSCLSLKNLTIGNSVEKIGSMAFKNCGDLTDIYIPASVRYIDYEPFEDTGLNKVEFESIESLCNIEFQGPGSNPSAYARYLYINGEEVTDLVIPNSVTSIGNYAFINCRSISSVNMGNSITAIGEGAFSNCTGLTEIVIPNSVTTIGESAFAGCTGLNSIILGSALTSIKDNTFSGCENINRIVIPNSVTTIGSGAFQDCSELDQIIIGHGIESIGSKAFYNTKASWVYITAETPPSAADDTFSNYGILEVPESIIYDYSYLDAWKGFWPRIINLDYEPSVTVQTPEFSGRPGDTFQIRCSVNATLTMIFFRSTNPAVATVDNYGKVTIQNGIEESSTNANGDNSDASCRIIVESLYANCPPAEILINNGDFTYTYQGQTLTYTIVDKNEKTCQTKSWNNAAGFSENNNSGDLVIPDYAYNGNTAYEVIAIGENSFYWNQVLTSVVIPNTVKHIGISAFGHCSKLTSIKIPESVTHIGESAFSGSNLSSVKIPESVTTIGVGAFSYCSNLSSVEIPESVTTIDESAFEFCYNLKEITIPNSVTSIGVFAFSSCENLTSVSIGNKISYIDSGTFLLCEKLTKIIIPNSVTKIYDNAFGDCYNLDKIVLGNGLKEIGEYVFTETKASYVYCTALTPPTVDRSFGPYTGTLYVPAAAAELYATTEPWSNFSNRHILTEATSLTLNATNISGNAGDTFQLTANVQPANVTLPYVFWKSTNPEIATVDNNGLVTIHVNTPEYETYAADGGAACQIIAETLYANGPIARVNIGNNLSGIDEIGSDTSQAIDYSKPYDVYNMQGIRVGSTTKGLVPGMYIVRQGAATAKIAIN